MTGFTHETGFEWDHIHGQTPSHRHQQVGLGQSESTPAETGTAVSLSQHETVLASAVVEPETPVRKAGSPALNEGRAQPDRRRAGEVHIAPLLGILISDLDRKRLKRPLEVPRNYGYKTTLQTLMKPIPERQSTMKSPTQRFPS